MRAFLTALLIALAGAASPGHAADDSLYRAFGEKAGLSTLMTDFVGRLKADAKIGGYFKDVKAAYLAEQLTDQLCKVSGGPCAYEGATMAQAHRDLEIDRAAFNRLVELLQEAMDARGIPFPTQNRMLALLAPMHRDIVTR
jgi:hemoglobin